MRKEIVISRYNEPVGKCLGMVPEDVDIIIYDKGEPVAPQIRERAKRVVRLPNTGREGHTYLWHIVENYDDLADVTFFSQGNCKPHLKGKKIPYFFDFKNVEEECARHAYLATTASSRSLSSWKRGRKNPPDHLTRALDTGRWRASRSKMTFPEWWTKYVRQELPTHDEVRFAWGGTFSVTKNYILSNSKRYYKKLLHTLTGGVNPEEGHYMERAWSYIFKPDELK